MTMKPITHTGMHRQQIAEELYFYTGGYPYLVSCLCKNLR